MDDVLRDYLALCIRSAPMFGDLIAQVASRYVGGDIQRDGLMQLASAISDVGLLSEPSERAVALRNWRCLIQT